MPVHEFEAFRMHPWIAAAVLGGVAVVTAGTLVRSLRNGVASSFVRTYHVDEEPLGYGACILGEIGIILLGAAMLLHAFGFIGNPLAAIDSVLPTFLRCSQSFCPP